MGDLNLSIKLTEDEIRQFNQNLSTNASFLIQEAAKKASGNHEGPVFLTPSQLPKFVNSEDQYYEAYRDYTQAFDQLLKSANTTVKLNENLNLQFLSQLAKK